MTILVYISDDPRKSSNCIVTKVLENNSVSIHDLAFSLSLVELEHEVKLFEVKYGVSRTYFWSKGCPPKVSALKKYLEPLLCQDLNARFEEHKDPLRTSIEFWMRRGDVEASEAFKDGKEPKDTILEMFKWACAFGLHLPEPGQHKIKLNELI